MLGTVARESVFDLIEAVAEGDGAGLLDVVARLAEQALDFAGILAEVLGSLHRIAVLQLVPDAPDDDPGARLRDLAARLPPEDVQLYYQIGLLGQRDLPFAPDPRSGLEMVLLRMLAFRPAPAESATAERDSAPRAAATTPDSERVPPRAPPTAASQEPDFADWHGTVERLGLGGMALQLARNCVVESWDGTLLTLRLDPQHGHMLGSRAEERLKDAIGRLVGRLIGLRIATAPLTGETPARRAERAVVERREAALAAMRSDEVVQALAQQFDARLLEDSVLPLDDGAPGPAGRD